MRPHTSQDGNCLEQILSTLNVPASLAMFETVCSAVRELRWGGGGRAALATAPQWACEICFPPLNCTGKGSPVPEFQRWSETALLGSQRTGGGGVDAGGPPLPSRQEVGTWKTGPFGISAASWACSQTPHHLLPVHKITIDKNQG